MLIVICIGVLVEMVSVVSFCLGKWVFLVNLEFFFLLIQIRVDEKVHVE